jgi:hypothetical protein
MVSLLILFLSLACFDLVTSGLAVSSSHSKLSIHTGMGTNSWKILNEGNPKLIKLLDSFDSAAEIKQKYPYLILIGRIYLPSQPQDGNPAQRAQDWWSGNNVGPTIMKYPNVDYWEGYNEPFVGDLSSMNWYAQFEVERVKLLAKYGRKAAIGCFSVGTPDVTTPAIIQAFYPAIDEAIKEKGILAVHEYSSPFVNTSFSGDVKTGSGWFTGRYRKLYNQYLIPTKRNISLAITENGIDGGTCSCDIRGGWKNFCSYWSQNGLGNDCNKAYLDQLAWYDQVIRIDSYVLGSTIFCLEIPGWTDFDIAPMTDLFINYLKSQN